MKTLKQLLIEKDNFNYKSMTYQDICNIVEKWLKQKPSDYTDGFGYEYLDKDRLLRELKEK